jgi:hypothetical protein
VDYVAFYNRQGRAVAWLSGDQDYPSIFLYDGRPVAWLSGDDIYDYSGNHLGWVQDGWVWDRTGKAVFFTGSAAGGPSRPARKARPARAARMARPARGARQARLARPSRVVAWSPMSDETFFDLRA